MTDIVERLRNAGVKDGFAIILYEYVVDAAVEIERLRLREAANFEMYEKRICDLKEVLQDCQSRAFQERHELNAEIERLRVVRAEAVAEIERLRAGQMLSLEELREWYEADHEDAITLHRNCVIRVLGEIERLREELRVAKWELGSAEHALGVRR